MGKTIRTEILCKKNFLLDGQTSWPKEKLSSALVNLLGSWLLMKSLSTVIEQLCFKKALNMVTSRPKLGILWVYNGVVYYRGRDCINSCLSRT